MEKKKSNKVLIIIIVLLLVIILCGVVYIIVSRKSGKNESEPTSAPTEQTERKLHEEAGLILTEKDAENYEKPEPTTFVTDYNREIFVKDGNQASCYMGNSQGNYFENMYFQLFLADENGLFSEDDELYLSGTIPRGSHIEKMELERSLDPGTYSGVVTFVMLNDDDEIVSSLNFAVDIISE